MNRREFLATAAASSVVLPCRAQDAARQAKLDRISIMSAGFSRLIPETWDRTQPATPKQMDIMDVPEFLADHLGLHHFEIQNIHFLSMEPSYCAKFNERLQKARCKVSNMPLELDDHGYAGLVGPSSSDPALRARAIDLTEKWIDVAASIGCPTVMVNQGTGPLPEDLGPCIETLRTMAAYGKTKNVAITMENRGRATPEQLANLIRSSNTYANPDLGNFPDDETRARGMRLLIPLAHHQCHVKMRPTYDFGAVVRAARDLGFKGIYSIEGGGPNPATDVQKFLDPLIENM